MSIKVLFVDDKVGEFQRFQQLPFAQGFEAGEIAHVSSAEGLVERVLGLPDVRLVVLDMLWGRENAVLGAPAARELVRAIPEIPVIIHSVMTDEDRLRNLVPEMLRLGVYDWVSKSEPGIVRSFKFERAFKEGRDLRKIPDSRAILPRDQFVRSDVHVGVMFADITGFTALTQEIGSERIVPVLGAFYEAAAQPIQRHGGYVDKYIGDAVMAVFGARSGGGDVDDFGRQTVLASRALVETALNFKRSSIDPLLRKHNAQLPPEALATIGTIRIGLESGSAEIVRFPRGNESEVTFIGRPVNIASRILGKAAPGEVWLGTNLYSAAGLAVEDIAETKEFQYKNMPGMFKAYRLKT